MANFLTLSRIVLILPFAAMFFVDTTWALKAALVIFTVAAATDLFDGWVARARSETSALGAALDPLADKLLAAAAILLLVRNGIIHGADVIAALAMLLREILVAGLREAAGRAGESIPVTPLAKWKTAFQLVALALLLASAPTGMVGMSLAPAASLALWAAALLTVITGADYCRRAIVLLRRAPG